MQSRKIVKSLTRGHVPIWEVVGRDNVAEQYEVTVEDDGTITLVPMVTVPLRTLEQLHQTEPLPERRSA